MRIPCPQDGSVRVAGRGHADPIVEGRSRASLSMPTSWKTGWFMARSMHLITASPNRGGGEMKLTSKVVLVAGMLTIPAAGTAQVANHVSMRLDLAASGPAGVLVRLGGRPCLPAGVPQPPGSDSAPLPTCQSASASTVTTTATATVGGSPTAGTTSGTTPSWIAGDTGPSALDPSAGGALPALG